MSILKTVFRVHTLVVALLMLLVVAPAGHADQPPGPTTDCVKTDSAFPYADTQAPANVNATSAVPGIRAWVCIKRLPGATLPYDFSDPTDYDQADRQAEFAAVHFFVEYRQTGTSPWLRTGETAWNVPRNIITGLQPNSEYEYRMVARSDLYPDHGWHTDSQTVTFRTPAPSAEPTPGPTPTPDPDGGQSGDQSNSGGDTTPTNPGFDRDSRDLVLSCTSRKLVLTNVYQQGSRVKLAGVADASLTGKRVDVRLMSTTKGSLVAHATVKADGTFSASAKLPPRSFRTTNRARYEVRVGKDRSSALKLTRRMVLTSIKRTSGGKVIVSGHTTRPFAQKSQCCSSRRAGPVAARPTRQSAR